MLAFFIFLISLERAEKLSLPGAQSWDEQMKSDLQYAPAVENWLDAFFSLWLEQEKIP